MGNLDRFLFSRCIGMSRYICLERPDYPPIRQSTSHASACFRFPPSCNSFLKDPAKGESLDHLRLSPAWNNNGLILFSSRHAAPIPSPSHDGSALTPAPHLVAATLCYKHCYAQRCRHKLCYKLTNIYCPRRYIAALAMLV